MTELRADALSCGIESTAQESGPAELDGVGVGVGLPPNETQRAGQEELSLAI